MAKVAIESKLPNC